VPVVNADGALGAYCLEPFGGVNYNVVSAGPNVGLKWVDRFGFNFDGSATDRPRWRFRWNINPDLDDVDCAFYQQQSGSYHPTNNPTGWILGANLRANTIRHEAGSVAQSHYTNFVAANSSNDIGSAAEALLGSQDTVLTAFATQSDDKLASIRTAIGDATKNPEPFGPEFNELGERQGFTNWSNYGPGCHP
jgi:hypothetical protein